VPEPDLGGQPDDIFEVAAHGPLAAGKMQLQEAELGGLRQHVEPRLPSATRRRCARAPAVGSNRGIAASSGG
jgi:hypothetical protein